MIGCVIIGAILGDIRLGLLMGIVFQPLWLAIVPVGGTFFPDGEISTMYFLWLIVLLMNSGTSISSVFFPAVLFIFLFAMFAGAVTTAMRKANTKLIMHFEKQNMYLNPGIYLVFGIVSHVFIWTCLMLIFKTLLIDLLETMAASELFNIPFKWTMSGVLSLGVVLLINMGKLKKYKYEALLGILIGGIGIWLT